MKEPQKILEELIGSKPEKLTGEAKRLFEAIMKIADERDELIKERQADKEKIKNSIPKAKVEEKIEELIKYKANLLKKDYAKKQIELPNQNVLVCSAIRDIAAAGKIQVLQELLKNEGE